MVAEGKKESRGKFTFGALRVENLVKWINRCRKLFDISIINKLDKNYYLFEAEIKNHGVWRIYMGK
jgi:hypothetical protein